MSQLVRASMAQRIALLVIRAYQRTVSPLLGEICRFEPSCSRYSATCFERFGFGRGLFLTMKRLAKCHPFHPGGIDFPPSAS